MPRRCEASSGAIRVGGLSAIPNAWREPPPRPSPASGRGRRSRAPRLLLRLVDIPEDRRRRAVEHAGQRFPRGDGRKILPERNVDDLLIVFLLDVGGDFLLLFRRRATREGVAQL